MNPGGLIDIINPAPPPLLVTATYWGLWAALLLALLGVAGGALWWRCRARRTVRRSMRQLQAKFHQGVLDERSAAYQIADSLRAYLKLAQLSAAVPPGLSPAARSGWVVLISQLDQLRYQPGSTLDAAQWAALWQQVGLCLRGCR
jgi:hypothetical protein